MHLNLNFQTLTTTTPIFSSVSFSLKTFACYVCSISSFVLYEVVRSATVKMTIKEVVWDCQTICSQQQINISSTLNSLNHGNNILKEFPNYVSLCQTDVFAETKTGFIEHFLLHTSWA